MPQESFGLNRFQVVAEGFIRAYRQGNETLTERLNFILDNFAAYKIDLARPYLNANSEDCYRTFMSEKG